MPNALAVQRVLLILMLPLHALIVLAQVLRLLGLSGPGPMPTFDRGASPFHQGEATGYWLVFVGSLVWGAAGAPWALYNAIALGKPTARLHASLLWYWIASIGSCICFPIGIVGLLHLNKRDVREAFGQSG